MATKGTIQSTDTQVDPSINQVLGVGGQDSTSIQSPQTITPISDVAVPDIGMQGEVVGSTQTETQSNRTPSSTNLNLGNYYQSTAPLVTSWENKAESIAGTQFQQNVLAGKQTLAKSAQEQQMQGQEMQTQLALGEYMRAQSSEKAGWTGGYMLDQKRQGDYLRASIQAQMYGAQELQKYGMETQLEAARLAYDLGKEQLAYQMYQEAQQLAVTEAGMFGYYISPEIKDMVNQYNAATTALADNPDDERAKTVKATLDEWFSKEGMSPNDLLRFGRITMEREQWNQAKLDAMLASIGDDPSVFLMRDEQGRYVTDPATGQYVKMNFEDVTTSDLLTFLAKDDGSTNKFADTAFRSYAKYLAQSTINAYFSSLAEGVVPTEDGFKTFAAITGNDRLQAYLNELGIDGNDKAMVESLLANNFNPSLTKDGVIISYKFEQKAATTSTNKTPTPPEIVVDPENPLSVYSSYKNPFTNTELDLEIFKNKYNSYYRATSPNAQSVGALTAEEFANLYVKDYNDALKLSENKPSLFGSYENWAKAMHRVHNTFITENYESYLESKIKTELDKQIGFDVTKINGFTLNASGTRMLTLEVPGESLNSNQMEKLKANGFTQSTSNGKLRFVKGLMRPDNLVGVPAYNSGSGWNDKYRTGGFANTGALFTKEWYLYTLLTPSVPDLTNTTEGEGRF